LWGGLRHQAGDKQGESGGLELHGSKRVIGWCLLVLLLQLGRYCERRNKGEETKAKEQQHTHKLYEYLANGFGAFAVIDMPVPVCTSRTINL
jgi:hypothetical protein